MKKLFIDTNILLDLLAERKPYYNEAAALFSMADKNRILLSISSLSIVNTHYILRKLRSGQEANRIIRTVKVLVNECALDDKITNLALNSDFNDFEDAIQYFTAIENRQDIIITRNRSDFKSSSLPVMSAGEFVRSSG
jgi:predicted nucleic acid-binding protein